MTHTETTAPTALYVVVMDGHTAPDGGTFYMPGISRYGVSRDVAIEAVDSDNASLAAMGVTGRWHAECIG